MVGCCNFGPCKKKNSYEFNNPEYEANKSAGTYRQSQLLEVDEENKSGEATDLEGNQGDAVDGDPGIKGVVAVDLDSDSPSNLGDADSSPDRRDSKMGRGSKRSSKKSSFSRKGSKRDSKRSGKNRKDATKKQDDGDEKSNEAEDVIEAGITPYHEAGDTEQSTTYTTVIQHHIGGSENEYGATGDLRSNSDKRNSNVSSRSSSSHRVMPSSFDPTGEGHFHSEHQYKLGHTHERKNSAANLDFGGRDPSPDLGEEMGLAAAGERSSTLVNVHSETEDFDNITNSMTEASKGEDEGWTTVTEVTETVVHINSPFDIEDNHRYTAY